MQTQLNRFTQNIRKTLRPRLRKYPTIHQSFISIHRGYCKMTGFLHVLPDFYIIGGQKCGTASLYTYLLQHPSVEPSISKEPSYFDRYYDRGDDWFKVCFPFKFHKFFFEKIKKIKFLTGEASVRYLDHPFTPERLKKITPNAKFIVLLRNPIDRAFSQYTRVSGNNRDSLSFEDAIEKEDERTIPDFKKMMEDETYWPEKYFTWSYKNRGIYLNSLKRWTSVFPKERFLIIESGELFKNTSKVYKDVLEFLDLPEWELTEYRTIGAAQYKNKMEQETRKKLIEFFKPHNEKLYEFLGRKFDWDK